MKKDLKEFKTFPSSTIKEIQRAANEGIYQIRGLGAKRKVPDFDDLVFLGASMSRYPLEGSRYPVRICPAERQRQSYLPDARR